MDVIGIILGQSLLLHTTFYSLTPLLPCFPSEKLELLLVGIGREESKSPNKWCIDISSRLRLLIVVPVIGEVVFIIRSTDNGSNKHIWIW